MLNQCTAGLVAEGGLDFERQRSASGKPEWTNMATVVRLIQQDYPRTALNRGEQGLIRTTLLT